MPRTRPAYDEEFKAQAVELYLNSDQGLKQVARELGISDASLRKWRNEFLEASEGLPVAEGNGRAAASARELADEIKRLRVTIQVGKTNCKMAVRNRGARSLESLRWRPSMLQRGCSFACALLIGKT